MEAVLHFVKPYPQLALNGALGITSADIAKSLGVAHKNVLEKIRRGRFEKACILGGWNLAVHTAKFEKAKRRGRSGDLYSFDVNAAKVFVSRWDNDIGIGYMRYLLSCEHKAEVAEGALLKLMGLIEQQQVQIHEQHKQLTELAKKLDAFERPKIRKGQKTWRVCVGYQSIPTLFEGEHKEAIIREIPLDRMTDDERRIWEAQHNAKSAMGLNSKTAKLLNREIEPGKKGGDLVPLKTH